MFCKNCGTELRDNVKFCANCGTASLEEASPIMETAEKSQKKKGKAPLIIGIAIAFIVVVAGVFAVRWYNSPEQQAVRAIADSDYDTVIDIINEDRSVTRSDSVCNKLNERILDIQKEYEAENTEYEAVCAELEQIEQLGIEKVTREIKDVKQAMYELYYERNVETFYLLTSKTFYRSNGNNEGESNAPIIIWTWQYDESGKLISTTEEGKDFKESLRYVYDDNGKINEVRRDCCNSGLIDSSVIYTASYTDDLLTGYSGTWEDKRHNEVYLNRFQIEFLYDEKGNIIKRIAHHDPFLLQSSSEYFYYDNGLLKGVKTAPEGEVYAYDEQGRITYRHSTELPSLLNYIHKYNEDGTLDSFGNGGLSLKEGFLGEDEYKPSGWIREWDEGRHELTFTCEDTPEIKSVYKYDENLNCTSISLYGSSGELIWQTTYSYEERKFLKGYEKPNLNNPIYLDLFITALPYAAF